MNIISKIKFYMLKTSIINMIPIIPIHTENRFICWLWSKIYNRWISLYIKNGYKVIAVTGWRRMELQQKFKSGRAGLIQTVSPHFWGLK